LLHAPALTQEAAARLQILARTDDGFAIAQEDLALRGPGEILGERQHGAPDLRLADLARDAALLESAREAAEDLCRQPLPALLQGAVLARWGRRLGLLAGG
jgi:ATP-dependent DNA helicase RecG